ncbi:glycosyltransferase family 2 protein [Escherichia coli]|uniref:glycosyltransferase family 2 protein n=6 Tax=Escherichia coli TaxID=562 RepID=UPI0004825AB2|nr:glycosyltransferase family 2 protein [Escherichia coli]EEZ9681636.1 glycosyltransferase [Escherichia coli O55]EFW6884533.1 glycosyltransferase [Shigella sonnei]EAB9356690.1 glycosyltransferase [Escherichia coli]EER1860875.1 glycosyltransferase [Escherichia coli]EER2443166.1 glycosyltransferase [Escherichia coli]
MKTISVVIPCFNCIQTIDKALQSVYDQNYKFIEIVCVDDCSTDNTYEHIKTNHPFVKLVKNDINLGPAASRNKGVRLCSGEFVAFLDADDIWFPNKTNIQIELMDKYGLDFIGASFTINTNDNPSTVSQFEIIKLYNLAFKNYFPTPSVIMKKNLVCFNELQRFSEDYDLWLRLAKDKCIMGYVKTPLISLGKPSYGHSGLSSNLIKMQLGEISSINKNLKGKWICFFAISWSFIKFIRRLCVVFIRKL